MPSIKQIFGAVGRLWLLRRPNGEWLRGRDAVIVLFAVIAVTEFALIDRYLPESAAQFYPDGFLALATCILVASILAWLLSRVSRPSPAFADTLLLVAGLSPVATGLCMLVDYELPQRWVFAASMAIAMYVLSYFRRGLRALTGQPQRVAVLVLAVVLGSFVWVANALGWSPSLWSEPSREADDSPAYAETGDRAEELLFSQAARIDAALARVAKSDKPQMYFVGFAGVAEEKVFADEIALAEHRIDDRYGVRAHEVLLINDQRDLDSAPLATVTGLARALRGIGAKMDRDRDVLFLALSSHGSSEPELAVSNGALPLLQLAPEDLREALDAAGIRWRVIVVSSCYAGAFIAPLRNDRTVIIAAAAADRTSFGCSNDRSLTYFGEAFYRDALPGARSLRTAFEVAKRDIEKREAAEKIDASHPTAFFGSALEIKLAPMEPRHTVTQARTAEHVSQP